MTNNNNLTPEQQQALNVMKSGKNIFLTGPAGTGKSRVIQEFTVWCKENNINLALTATTGVAALHIGGRTLHSWAGIFLHILWRKTSKHFVLQV